MLGNRPGNASIDLLDLTGPEGEQRQLRFEARVHTSQVTGIHALCVAGWGIGVAVSEEDQQALDRGLLLPVLPGWRLPEIPLYAVTARRGEQPAKVRHALDLLSEYFGATQPSAREAGLRNA